MAARASQGARPAKILFDKEVPMLLGAETKAHGTNLSCPEAPGLQLLVEALPRLHAADVVED